MSVLSLWSNCAIKVVFTATLLLGFWGNLGAQIKVGAADTARYFPLLKEKRIAVVANPTSRVYEQHLIRFLQARNFQLTKIFALEHGIYGKADAGEKIKDGTDPVSGLPVISLYGSAKEPKAADLTDVDVILFDIQDVGVRFYTYISSLHYIMQAAAKSGVDVMVLDRPNPNGHLIDGPVLEKEHRSFVGMHPIPVLHGMTIGEYGLMINGEYWLEDSLQCQLTVIPCTQYRRTDRYELPVPPSPNLPNYQAVRLYPSLCFFEGTSASVGRGTAFPFQVFGAPHLDGYRFNFTPKPTLGAKSPKHEGKACFGKDLRQYPTDSLTGLHLEWLMEAHKKTEGRFFINFFTLLAGTKTLQEQIEKGTALEAIRQSWQPELEAFKQKRQEYLLYP